MVQIIMGHHFVHMVSIIIFFIIIIIISFYCIVIANSSLLNNGSAVTHHHNLHIVQVSQSHHNNNKALILKRLRSLVGLKSFRSGSRKSRNGEYYYAYFSPSPSPSLSPGPNGSPAPSPVQRHAHPPTSHHYHHSLSPHHVHTMQKKKKGTSNRTMAAVVVSLGTTSAILCAIGLFFGCRRKLKKKKKRSRKTSVSTMLVMSSSNSSVKKVISDPGPDLFYIDTIQTALVEQQEKYANLEIGKKAYFNQINTSTTTTLDHHEREGSDNNKNLIKSILSSSSSSSGSEITTVVNHEVSDSLIIKNEPEAECSNSSFDDDRKKIISIEAHSSDDESFHSFGDIQYNSFCDESSSHQLMLRLSNASASSQLSVDADHQPTTQMSSKPEISQSQPTGCPPPPPTPPLFLHIPPPLPIAPPPPPPPPPPSTSKNVYSLKTPPPPTSQLTQDIPLGKDGSPLPKLKPLHWDKVRAAPHRSTVWDKLRSSSFEFDEEMIESLFGYNIQNSLKNNDEVLKSKTPSPGKHVLEPKRLHNITILSKALNATPEQVCGALIRGDGLSLQDLEALSKMEPTKEEEAKLSNYKGDHILELGSAEKLVQKVLQIPFAFSRIEAMLYKETFDDEVLHLRKSFSMLEEACKELRSSRLFLKLLEAVLKTGNRMNVGTIRGGAKAFKLDALLKLADVKGTDGKTTLLHFVVQEIIRSEGIRVSESIMGKINQRSPEDKEENYRRMGLDLVSGLTTELCNVKKTATVDLDVLASSVANLSDGLSKLQHLVQKDMRTFTKGNFVNTMRSFLNYAEIKLKELQGDENRVLLHVREITEYFHGDVSKDECNPLRIFVIVRDFLSMLDVVCKELRSGKAPRTTPINYPLAPFR